MITPAYEERLFASIPLAEQAKDDLLRRMTAPLRHYHTVHHLELLWSRHRQYRPCLADRRLDEFEWLIALAIAYHDAVFVAGDPNNEMLSADLWLQVSATATDLSCEERCWVADTIRATADHLGSAKRLDMSEPGGFARQWVLDLDLTPLGEAPDEFDRNMELLKAEAPHKTMSEHDAGLQAALRYFASARPLYRSQPLASAFADSARRNFERNLVLA